MATDAAKAGKYELLADEFHEYDKDGKTLLKIHTKGDIVSLDADQAQRLTTGERPAFGEPGAAAQAEADRLQAAADAAKERADEAKARAVEAAKDASAAAKPSSSSS